MITSREHCDFLKGYYHDTAFLCSQVYRSSKKLRFNSIEMFEILYMISR